ncbi:MAG TPA: hypothetical protein VKZ68_09210 [Ohtaekwangia sp.]|nr:hypothetical protein [Ohtaekwangia sp.]
MIRLISRLIATVFVVIGLLTEANAQTVQYYFTEGTEALKQRNFVRYDSMIAKALMMFPQHPVILWHAGKAAALNNKADTAIHFLRKAINIRTDFNLSEADLFNVWKHPGFANLEKEKATLETAVISSDTAFVINDRQLHLESVAWDPREKVLYGGSIHKRKIIRIARDGTVTDFTKEEEHGMTAVFGVKVDSRRRILWACASPMKEMQNYDSAAASALYQFDLKTGKLTASYIPGDTLTGHVFGDVILDKNGNPFVSDSKNNVIYTIDREKGVLIPFFTSPEFWNLQGMAFSDDFQNLYVSDYIKGIYVIDMRTRQLTNVKTSYAISLKGSDGIYFYGNSLITIQNGVYPHRVVRHWFNETKNAFVRYTFVDNNHPVFGEPTIGTFDGNTFYYVATSQWNGYENGKVKAASELRPIVILRCSF